MKNEPNVIYDFGSNNGDDIAYYLKKAPFVVAVEANPKLCELIRSRFSHEISQGRLFVENCVLNVSNSDSESIFYVHRTNNVLSQFPCPPADMLREFEAVMIPSAAPSKLIDKYGSPLYVKIDLEGYDEPVLRHLFANGIHPPFISAESHTVDIFSIFVSLGKYVSFNLVDGDSVNRLYGAHTIVNFSGDFEAYSFPYHSAGPFGYDISSPWMSGASFVRLLALEGFGWKDIHATNKISPDPSAGVRTHHFLRKALNNAGRNFIRTIRSSRLL